MSHEGTKASHSGGHTRSRQPTAHHHQAANAILTAIPPRVRVQIPLLTLDQVAHELGVSRTQVYAPVRRDELEGVRFGGRGIWRVERIKLEEYLAKAYDDTRRYIAQHPFREDDDLPADECWRAGPVRHPPQELAFAAAIRVARTQDGRTQADVAKQAGLSVRVLQRAEQGLRRLSIGQAAGHRPGTRPLA